MKEQNNNNHLRTDLSVQGAPIWVREKTITAKTGLTRSILRGLREDGLVKWVSLKRKGCKQGTLLYHYPSLLEYLEESWELQKREICKHRSNRS